jgi:glucose/arabinose dehydrogenase
VFGPDGALYFGQGSNTSFGAPDPIWGNRAQRAFSATILRLDVNRLPADLPLDVRTPDAGGAYDPLAPDAPLTVYARGVRQAWDLLWHSNGRLYAPINGSSAGGNTPAGPGAPALAAIPDAEPDVLLRVSPGRYYGHPNAALGHHVLNGGNPTAGPDPFEVPHYPVGTRPDPAWDPPVYDFGNHVSANGVIEYRNRTAFGGRLAGWIIVCRYNAGSDLLALRPDVSPAGAGDIRAAAVGITGFTDLLNPLDVTEDVRSGNLYVSEYGAQRLTLLRPVRP